MNSLRWGSLIAGILLVALGVWLMFTPIANLLSLAFFIFIVMMVSGISDFVQWRRAPKAKRSGWMLMHGILTIILGIWVIFGKGTIADIAVVLPFILAFWVVCSGIMRTVGAFALQDEGYSGWGWMLALGILGILFGTVLMYNPFTAALMISIAISLLFIYQGVCSLILFFTFKDF